MVRLTTIRNVFSGISMTIVGVSGFIWYLLGWVSADPGDAWFVPFYFWLGSLIILGIVLLMSFIVTFTEMTGFVHPDDKLFGNMVVFLNAIATILVLGLLYPSDTVFQQSLFNVASMIVIAYVFLFVFVYFSASIMEGGEGGQVKEMTSRFMLVSLALGALMAAIKVGLDWVWVTTDSYGMASLLVGIVAVVLVALIVLVLGRRYEPIGE